MIGMIVSAIGIGCALHFFMWLFRSFDWPRQKIKNNSNPIRLAIAIPAHNEERSIAKTVRSIIEAGIERRDIFILCNGCKDKTAEEVAKCGVKPVIVPVRGKEETLNYANHELHLFRGYTHVCFFDADTVIDREYFRVTRDRLRDDPTIDIICGMPKSLPCNWLTAHRAVQYWRFHAIDKAAQGKIGAILVVPGCAGTYSNKVLQEIPWSGDTRIGDMDMTIQAMRKKKKILFEPRAIVYTQDPANIRDYTSQLYRRWYRGFWMNMGKHGMLWRGPFSILHWDCRLMLFSQFEMFFFPVIYWWFFIHGGRGHYPLWNAWVVFFSVVTLQAIACACAEKRWDILRYIPLFPALCILDTLLFVLATPNILVKREKSGEWSSPTRYEVS